MLPEVHEPKPQGPADADLSEVLREYMEVTGRLQRTHEALQEEVMRLRRELASKDRELELRRRLAALGELAAGVAHEVRNPLGAIQLYSGLLRDQCSKFKLETALELIEKIEAGIQAIDGVVQDTLALAPRDRKVCPCELRRVVERARDASLKILTSRQVALEVSYECEGVRVQADKDGLQRVLVNLFANAAEASPPQSVVRVQVGSVREGQVELRVCDEGGGLADEIVDRVFDPFFTTKEQGTGLGLTIAHRLIEACGGQLKTGNGPGGGAEFVILVPAEDPSRAQDGQENGERQFSAA